MQLYKRKGYWWVATRYWDAESGKRQRVQRSTGIRDDGTAGAKRTANIVAEDIARSVAIGQDRRVRQATVKEAFAANLKAKRTGQRSDATIEITLEKGHQSTFPLESIRAAWCVWRASSTSSALRWWPKRSLRSRRADELQKPRL